MLARETVLLALYAASSGAAASQSCYSLTGALLDQSFAPCNPDAKHSGCCATNRTSGADVCLDSGLCMSTTSEYMGTIWQPGCTDSTGKASECPQVCPGMNNNFDGLNPVSGWNIQTCDFGTYCCRAIDDNRSCCNNSTAPSFTSSTLGGYNFQAAAVDSSSPTVVTTTAVASSPSATGPPPNEGAKLIPNADVCESEKHKTLVVGGTIGGVLGAAVVGLLGLVFWMAKREQRQRKLKEHYEEQFAQTWAYRKHMAASTTSVKTESHEMKTTDHHEEFMSKASGS